MYGPEDLLIPNTSSSGLVTRCFWPSLISLWSDVNAPEKERGGATIYANDTLNFHRTFKLKEIASNDLF